MGLKRIALTAAILGISSFAFSQGVTGINFRAGYFASGRYTKTAGGGNTNEGLEFGADIPVFPRISVPGFTNLSFAFSPSVVFLGSLSSGSSNGQVYRLLASASASIPTTSLYGRVGIGYATTSSTNLFSTKSSYDIDYTLGLPIVTKLPGIGLSAEITYHQSSAAVISGWTIGLSAKF